MAGWRLPTLQEESRPLFLPQVVRMGQEAHQFGGGDASEHTRLTYLHEAGQQDPEGDLEGCAHVCVVDAQDWKGLSSLQAVFSDGMVNRTALRDKFWWGSGDIPN